MTTSPEKPIARDALFYKAPLAMFIVDRDRRVCRLNDAAAAMANRVEKAAIGLRGGELLRCVNAFDDPRGCGYGNACDTCTVRRTVVDTFLTGEDHRSVEAPIPFGAGGQSREIWVSISTTHLKMAEGERVLVCLEDISDRKRAEANLQTTNEALLIRDRIAHLFLTNTGSPLFAGVLSLVLDKMESRYGYFGYIDDRGDLVCPSMTRGVWDRCRVADKSFVFPRDCWGGVWGKSLEHKVALRRNENLNLPQGHVPLHNALVVPLVVDEILVGQMAVAEKPTPYTEKDQENLESIARFTAPILQIHLDKEKARNELRSHARVLDERNTALKVLIENREEEKQQLVERITRNFEKLVIPYYERLMACRSTEERQILLEILKSNTRECLSHGKSMHARTYRAFTPLETQVADLIKAGRTSKEIGAALNISPRTVYFHRNNLRRKLSIHKTRTNLKTFLTTHR